MSRHTHPDAHPDDPHFIARSAWLRAAVLGANDGIVSVASLLAGVAASGAAHESVMLAGLAGLSAGALSMAAGEYVSVSSQADIERADILRETEALSNNPHVELEELAGIYEQRGLSPDTALTVARELTEHDALAAHIRDELGLSDAHDGANPVQAAVTSALTFSAAGAVPLAGAALSGGSDTIMLVWIATLLALALLGAVGARAGGAPIGKAVLRVLFWGSFAMAVTAGIGRVFGVAMG
ncbi:VIT1/CCC1 transporter family protein [Paracoccus aerodenitrificans]|uniref:VIT1/CCC1 transporter family protein n=1 Tax=Paracoccus aerodenitrificans TaxID=3017781 RepID=UPI0022EFF378|nr:VIT family protein [Paracoccus aerodenitrificans]WBU64099.1 VIT family protein [Paracoccus aerodenitrificans]